MNDAQVDALLGTAFRTLFASPRMDEVDVGNVVTRHALHIGCTDSNATAAVAWAIRNGHDTLSAIRAGKLRAEQLRIRELSGAYRTART